MAEPFYDRLINGMKDPSIAEDSYAYFFAVNEIHQKEIQADCFFSWRNQLGDFLKKMTHAEYSEFMFDLVYLKMKLNKFDEACHYLNLLFEDQQDLAWGCFDSLGAIEGTIKILEFMMSYDANMNIRLSNVYQHALKAEEEWESSEEEVGD